MALSNPIDDVKIKNEIYARIANKARSYIVYAKDAKPAADVPDFVFKGNKTGPGNPSLSLTNPVDDTNVHNAIKAVADAMRYIRSVKFVRRTNGDGGSFSDAHVATGFSYWIDQRGWTVNYPTKTINGGNVIADGQLQTYMDSWWNTLSANNSVTDQYTFTVCHSSCHSSCHNSRGRR